MVTNVLGIILQELGKSAIIPISDLVPDKNNSCLIKLPGDISLQIELDKSEQNLLIGCDLGAIPPGRYRMDIFREALRANNTPYPRYGTFAYSTKKGDLLLFYLLPVEDYNGEKLAEHLKPFIEKAHTWITAIKAGELPTTTPSTSQGLGSLLGLR
jgi:hypothetical protein